MKRPWAVVLAALFLTSCGVLGDSNPTPTPSPQKTFNFFGTPTPTPAVTASSSQNPKPFTKSAKDATVSLGSWAKYGKDFGILLTGPMDIRAPFDGTVNIALLDNPQNLQGEKYVEIDLFADVSTQPTDKTKLIIVLGTATNVVTLVSDGAKVKAGDRLASIVGAGASFAYVFHNDPNLTGQIFGKWFDSSGNQIAVTEEMATKLLVRAK